MIKTAIENKQNLILEGCYLPAEWKESFSEAERKEIKCLFIVMSEAYIRAHFAEIVTFANVIEKRLDDRPDMERLIACSKGFQEDCEEYGIPLFVIDQTFCPEDIVEAIMSLKPSEG